MCIYIYTYKYIYIYVYLYIYIRIFPYIALLFLTSFSAFQLGDVIASKNERFTKRPRHRHFHKRGGGFICAIR